MPRIAYSHGSAPRTDPNSATFPRRKLPSQARSREMVDAILRAAARILIRDGYDKLTTNDVAIDAGASVGSLYQYFSSKEELVSALLDQHIDRTMGAIRAEMTAVAMLSVPDAVRRFVELMIQSHAVEPELHRVFVEQLPRIGSFSRIEASLIEGQQMAEAYLRAHEAEITPRDHKMTAFLLVQTVEALTHAAVISRRELLQGTRLIDEITRLVLGYLMPTRNEVNTRASTPKRKIRRAR